MKVCEDDAGGAFIRATAWRSQVDEDDFWRAFIRAIYVSHICAAHGDFPLLFFQRDVCVFDWVGRSEIARCQITVLTFAGAFEFKRQTSQTKKSCLLWKVCDKLAQVRVLWFVPCVMHAQSLLCHADRGWPILLA